MGPGDVLDGRFELQRPAASGGMGIVYRAVDRLTGELAAVKAIRVAGDDLQRRFVREAELLAALRHPGIVGYLAHGKIGDELYLAMEWLEGEDLATRLAMGELSVEEAVVVATQIAGALGAAHALGMVHRDVKPSNVFLVDWRPDRVKLLDFGVARRAGLEALTATGLLVGTPAYMAPEQARGRRDLDARVDVYALGALLFRCLTGRTPFGGDGPEEVIAHILADTAPRVRSLAPAVPSELDALVARMLAREPARRPDDGLAAHAALIGLGDTTARPAPVRPPTESSLVGRAAEQAAIDAALAQPQRGALLLFTGEPGIGKSRLLEEIATRVRARDGVVLRGRAFEAEMVRPYGAWIDALRSAPIGSIGSHFAGDLAPLLPELGGDGPATAAPADRARLFDAVVRLLAGLGDEAVPVAVLLDDLQWFDEASLALLHFAVRALDGRRVLVAAGARPGELDENRAASRLVRDLTRDQRLTACRLAPLGADEVAALVGPGDAARVFAESEGNPLFALEIARARRQGQVGPPASLADLLADRLERLDDATRELVPWAAALGRSFDLEVLARVTGQPLAALVAVASTLERRGIVRVAAAGGEARYDFAHDLLRDAAYRQMSEPRRRVVHLAIARALAAPELNDTVAGDVLHHAAHGGAPDLAVRAAVLAGHRGLRVFANVEAAELAARGLALAPRLPRLDALPMIIELLYIQIMAGRWDEALVAALAAAIAEAREAGLAHAVQRGLMVFGVGSFYAHDYDNAYETSLALAAVDADAATRAVALAGSARCLIGLEREIPRAEELLREARVLAEQARIAPIDVPLGLGQLSRFRGHDEAAAVLLEEAFQRAVREHDHWRSCEALTTLTRLDLEHGRPARALERTVELRRIASRLGEGGEEPFAAALAALARYALAAEGAAAEIERAIAALADRDCKEQLAYVLNFVATIELERGSLQPARAHAARALRCAEDAERTGEIVVARALLAQVDLALGQRQVAEQAAGELTASMADGVLPARSTSAVRRVVADLEKS